MSISEHKHMPEPVRRIEVFTGAGRRRSWSGEEKAAIVAASYGAGETVCAVARRHGLTPQQLFAWRRLRTARSGDPGWPRSGPGHPSAARYSARPYLRHCLRLRRRRRPRRLRFDPAFKLACGRLPDSGRDLCSQPTVSRWENAPALRDLIRLMDVMVDLYCASYTTPPAAVTLDIDDTVDVVHGHQQLALFNAHYDERCFLPIHVYDTATSRPVAVLLRPGKTPSGTEIRGHLRRLVRRIRRHWPQTRITIRGDGHYGRPRVMEWG